MHILVSNDDGYHAPGIAVLAEAMQRMADQVTVIAPDRDRSASSNSLTVTYPLRVHTAESGFYYVDGTPTDCVHLAITGLLKELPTMVVSGINSGSNLGDDVIYSGTVAAAMEGRFLGSPAIAISSVSRSPKYYTTAASVACQLVERMREQTLPSDTILNVNVPDVAMNELAGWRVTRLGNRHKSEPVIKSQDPKGREIYWVGPAGAEQDAGPGTDFDAINNNYVSITPLKVDLTRYDVLDTIKGWLEQ